MNEKSKMLKIKTLAEMFEIYSNFIQERERERDEKRKREQEKNGK